MTLGMSTHMVEYPKMIPHGYGPLQDVHNSEFTEFTVCGPITNPMIDYNVEFTIRDRS